MTSPSCRLSSSSSSSSCKLDKAPVNYARWRQQRHKLTLKICIKTYTVNTAAQNKSLNVTGELEKWIFKCLLNESLDTSVRMRDGSEFHACGPATENDFSASRRRVRCGRQNHLSRMNAVEYHCVCDVRAPCSDGWTCRQYFCTI